MPYLINNVTGDSVRSFIAQALDSDYQLLEDSDQFQFNWTEEKQNEVYKIYLPGEEGSILGMMSLVDRPDEYRIHMKLIEIRKEHQGKDKKIANIAGCLLAFACQLAFVRGYDGFVSLQPKTKLVRLYQEKYGFRQYGRLLAVESPAAHILIKKYLPDEK